MYRSFRNVLKTNYLLDISVYNNFKNNADCKLRIIRTSNSVRTAITEAVCPHEHNSPKSVDEGWAARCHVDKETWDKAKPYSEMPGLANIPFIGNTWRFLPGGEYYKMTPMDLLNKLHGKFGNIVKMEGILGISNAVHLNDPNDIELIYKQESLMPSRDLFGSMTYFRENYRQDLFKDARGLLSSNGEEWYTFRNKVNKIMMQPKAVRQYVKPVDKIAGEFVDKIKRMRKPDGTVGDVIMHEFNKWALESIAFLALDQRLGCLEENLAEDSLPSKMIKNTEEIFTIGEHLDFRPNLWRYISTRNFRKGMRLYNEQITLSQTLIDKATEKIKEKREAGVVDDREEKSVLEKLLDIDQKVAVVMASDMVFAGIDTTSTAFINILYQLSCNSTKQQKLRDEILSQLSENDSEITTEKLLNMHYLKACIKEAGRLYPVTVGTMRNLTKDAVLSGYQIPKGKRMLLVHMKLSLNEKYFPRPLEFIPERWLRENNDTELSYKNAHPFASMQFGFGSRSCIGRRFAELELEVGLVNFIKKFDISWKGGSPEKVTTSINYLRGPFGFVFNDLK